MDTDEDQASGMAQTGTSAGARAAVLSWYERGSAYEQPRLSDDGAMNANTPERYATPFANSGTMRYRFILSRHGAGGRDLLAVCVEKA